MKMGVHLKDQRAYQKMLQDPLAGQRGTLPSALELATVFGCEDGEKDNYVKLWRNYSNMERGELFGSAFWLACRLAEGREGKEGSDELASLEMTSGTVDTGPGVSSW